MRPSSSFGRRIAVVAIASALCLVGPALAGASAARSEDAAARSGGAAAAPAPALPIVPFTWFTVTRFCFFCGGSATAGADVTFRVEVESLLFGSPWAAYAGNVNFGSSDTEAVLPPSYTFTGADAGVHFFTVRFRTAGPQTLTVRETGAPDVYGTSDPVNIVPAASHHTLFSVQPGGAQAGSPLSTQPVVLITDEFGNRTPSTTAVTLSLVPPSGSAGAALACGGTGTTVAAVAGAATFAGCSVSIAGVGYTMVASSPGLFSGSSAAFTITAGPAPSPTPTAPPATALVISASPGTVTYPATIMLTVAFAGAGPSRLLAIQRRVAGATDWEQIGTVTTDAMSTGSLEYTPPRTAEYRATWAGDPALPAATSASATATVRFLTNVSPATTSRSVKKGTTLTWTGRIQPAAAGVTLRFQVYQLTSTGWTLRGTTLRSTNAAGKATFSRKFSVTGRWSMVLTSFAGPQNAGSTAPRKYVTVK